MKFPKSKLVGKQPKPESLVFREFTPWWSRKWQSKSKRELASLMFQIIERWSLAEFRLGGVYFHLSGKDPIPFLEQFLRSHPHPGGRSHGEVKSLAQTVLGPDDRTIFLKIFQEFINLYPYRNALAHGVVAKSRKDRKKIALFGYKKLLKRSAKVSSSGGTAPDPNLDRMAVGHVFSTHTLRRISKAMRIIETSLNRCCNYLSGAYLTPAKSDGALRQLLDRRELSVLLGRGRKKRTSP